LASCPKCSVDIPTEYKYCPHCGSQLLLSLDGILLAKLFGEVDPRKGVHSLAQTRLWTIGKELGFYSTMEYGVPDLTKDGRRSYIDVVWKSRNGIEFAFEVRRKIHDLDLVTTIKDTNKLQNLIARKKFVVNVSEITGRAYFCEISDEPTAPVSEPIPRMTFESSSKNMEQKKAYSVAVIRQSHPRAYEKWTDAEDTELTNNYREGLSTLQLAERHKRKRGAISSRLRKLGLMQ
jgi:hypothetical protein